MPKHHRKPIDIRAVANWKLIQEQEQNKNLRKPIDIKAIVNWKLIQEPTDFEGYIYIAYAPTMPKWGYKIGYSKKPKARMKGISGQLPIRCELVHQYRTDDMVGDERRLHAKYEHCRNKPEWFMLTRRQLTDSAITFLSKYRKLER